MLAFFCALMYLAIAAPAEPLDLEIRVSWGNGDRRLWSGSISVSEGVLQSPRCLGIEADAPDRFLLEENTLQFQQRAPMSLDGVDLRLIANEDATLTIQLIPTDQPELGKKVEIPVADFIPPDPVVHDSQLDDRRNRLVVQRTPGDRLRVRFDRASMIFSPQEEFVFEVQPHTLGVVEGTSLRCAFQLTRTADSEVLWKDQLDARVDASGGTNPLGPITVPLPVEEGVYEIFISLNYQRRFFGDAIVPGKPLFQRKLQLIVLDSQPRPVDSTPWVVVEEFDSADPKWWERWFLLATKLPGITPKGPLGDKPLRAIDRAGQRLQELGPSGWHAAPIPISQVGLPHILEIEFPRGVRQTLGISILEADAAGDVGNKGLDSGIDVIDESPKAEGVEKHRLVFWPRTKNPWLLLTNRRDNGAALFGKMRVYAGPEQLSPTFFESGASNRRLVAAHFDKPLFTDNFGAPEALDVNSNRSLRDWKTFYLGAIRLAEYLKYAGYNAAFIPVASDGTALYPTELLDVLPKWDNGAFFVTAQDPRPKDVLELLFRIFDREGLTLIPILQFGNALPELEERLAEENNLMSGIALVGAYRNELTPSLGTSENRRGLAPSYNPLDPKVQAAMQRVITELLGRCRGHGSFGGLCLQLNPYGYAQFPDESWGLDDATFTRFAHEYQIQLPLQGSDPYAARLALTRGPMRERWLKWRAFRLAEFYRTLQQEIPKVGAAAPLYLDVHELMGSRPVQSAIRPQLPPREQFGDAMLKHGIDPPLCEHRDLILLRPHRIGPSISLASQATNIELANSTLVDDYFRTAGFAGGMNYHERLTHRVPGFDAVSPFGPAKTQTWLSAHISPTGEQSRKNFVRSLVAFDAMLLSHGGWMLPLGQEDSLRPIFQVIAQLPAEPFTTVPSQPGDSSMVVVRTLQQPNATFIYVANGSGLRSKVELQLQNLPANAEFELLAGREPSPVLQAIGNSLELQLDKFDVVAFVVRNSGVRVANWSIDYDAADVSQLRWRAQEFGARVDGLRIRRPIEVLLNPDFEKIPEADEVPGWTVLPPSTAAIRLDQNSPKTGTAALHFEVKQDRVVGKVRSNPFSLPRTGRLSVLARLRTSVANQQPTLRMTIEGKLANGVPISLPSLGMGAMARPLPTRWEDRSTDFLFHVVDLPGGPGELAVGFDMLGPGEVWIDDVQVFDLYFHDAEQNELIKQFGNLQLQLQSRRYDVCQRFLDGYWPRFVLEFAPPPVNRISRVTSGQKTSAPQTPPKAEEKPSRWKIPNPIPLKLRKDLF